MSVEDADCVGIQSLELVEHHAVLAWGVGLVLQTLDSMIDQVPFDQIVR